MILKVEHVSFHYPKGKRILDDVSLTVEQGEILGILGPNGTGKTTLIKCLDRILLPDSGQIEIGGKSLNGMTANEVARQIAYVPQYVNGFFSLDVIDAVMMGRIPYVGSRYSEEDEKLVFHIMKQMNIEKFAFRNVRDMSGGERQRVFIARAMAQQPQLIILDEPTASLDLHNQLFILHTISELAQKQKVTIIMTIHDLNLASMFCDTLMMLKDTRILAYGRPEQVLTEQNIETMYNVHAKVTDQDGYKHVILQKSLM